MTNNDKPHFLKDAEPDVIFGVVGLVVAAVVLVVASVGLVALGFTGGAEVDAVTGLVSIGSAVAGGFAGWMTRGVVGGNTLPQAPPAAPPMSPVTIHPDDDTPTPKSD
jgi:hypothetical protein